MAEPPSGAGVSKLVEQATSKADLSYSYWAAKTGEYTSTPDVKLLSEEEAARHAQQISEHVHQTGASAWNTAGTFEERGVSLDWVQAVLLEIAQSSRLDIDGTCLELGNVTSCTGEAHQWLVRGKKRAGFELEVEFELRPSGQEETLGTLRVTQASSDDLDEIVLTWKQKKDAEIKVKRARLETHARPLIIQHLEALLDRIKAR